MAAPIIQKTVSKLLVCFDVFVAIITIQILTTVITTLADGYGGFLLCRKCGNEVVEVSELLNISSKLAQKRSNNTFGGSKPVLIQLFKNPHGQYFEVVTSKSADTQTVDVAHFEDTFFPGFAWTIIVCPRCGSHIGWLFEDLHKYAQTQVTSSFYGLILDSLLHEKEADAIIEVPKIYKS